MMESNQVASSVGTWSTWPMILRVCIICTTMEQIDHLSPLGLLLGLFQELSTASRFPHLYIMVKDLCQVNSSLIHV